MKLTKKRAIKLTIELWEFLAETGLLKEKWDGWDEYDEIKSGCFLCEYVVNHGDNCENCPYCQKFGECGDDDTNFSKWCGAKTIRTRKTDALKVLEELRQL